MAIIIVACLTRLWGITPIFLCSRRVALLVSFASDHVTKIVHLFSMPRSASLVALICGAGVAAGPLGAAPGAAAVPLLLPRVAAAVPLLCSFGAAPRCAAAVPLLCSWFCVGPFGAFLGTQWLPLTPAPTSHLFSSFS